MAVSGAMLAPGSPSSLGSPVVGPRLGTPWPPSAVARGRATSDRRLTQILSQKKIETIVCTRLLCSSLRNARKLLSLSPKWFLF